ncbi:MAG TPA: rhodanese-like domain-containing protein, partial [Thalassobaculum sp.]
MSASATDDLVAGGLVSTEWLAARLDDPRVKVLDGTYHRPTAARDGDAEFLERHIPGAARFDIDDGCDPGDSLPHMIPSPERFAEKVSALGISNSDTVVVYDVYGLQSSARTWWMFRLFGHDAVAVLDGGLPKWSA